MEFIKGLEGITRTRFQEFLEKADGEETIIEGAVHSVRDMGEIEFIILRTREGLIQTVWEKDVATSASHKIHEGDCLKVTGIAKTEKRAPHEKELRIKSVEVLSTASEPLPLPIGKWVLNTSLEAKLNCRALALRNVKERASFRIQEGLVRAFREYLYQQGFTEIHTPKIGAKSAEGGANMFKLSYFHRPAILQQSPQLYKQMMVGVFERVFETGPVFRAEKHSTRRHLNEYISLDFEMGYIDSFFDICKMEAGYLKYAMKLLQSDYQKELKLLGITLPNVEQIPYVKFEEAKHLVAEKYNRKIRNPFDLEPEEEELIGKYFQEEYRADFVFVTHYPSKKRPFYAMDDPSDSRCTLSFDLLFKGVEVTTGGQRIHDYEQLVDKIEQKGMTKEGLEQYLDAFRFGIAPHGGSGIGLERLTMQLIGAENIRETSLFPRDMSRLEP